MQVANIHEAKTHLSQLLSKAMLGEEIWIGKAGKPMVKLVPAEYPKKRRVPGALRGKIWIADDFDETPADLIAAFEGRDEDEL